MNNSGNTNKILIKQTLSKKQVWTNEYVIRMSYKKAKNVYLDCLWNY